METGSPDARYAILDRTAKGWSVTYRCVPYDHRAMARLATDRNRVDWARVLATVS